MVTKLLLCAGLALFLAACNPDTPGCVTNIAGAANTVSCGGGGDDADVSTTTPAPVVVTPVVIVPEPASE
jgi:hypothetical protein